MDENRIEDWFVVCRSTQCRHRFPIPPDVPVEWKRQKFRGVCGHGKDKIILELKEPVKCPKCGEESYRTIPRHFQIPTRKNCSLFD
ncbi:hypothetical protein [Methanobacterium sp.]|jgi:hypothetical protein|uniref:hypothetical protein n=1 Tax=Methanobacterium sp. TaxID=2164 RepID=UPI00057CBDC7|nr:hypothetical protein [Methanobacterium sp.]